MGAGQAPEQRIVVYAHSLEHAALMAEVLTLSPSLSPARVFPSRWGWVQDLGIGFGGYRIRGTCTRVQGWRVQDTVKVRVQISGHMV